MAFEKTMRWFGFDDNVRLSDLKQAGVEGVVTALHHIPNGEVWSVEEIMKVKSAVEEHGMRWSVVESLPVAEGIKTRSPGSPLLISNYRQSLRNLGRCGIDTVCYNFMPVLDWVRTDLHYTLPSGGEVMYFDFPLFVAFDLFILNRPGAENDYPADIVAEALEKREQMTGEEAERLAWNIIVLSQGFIDGVVNESVKDYKQAFLGYIEAYKGIDRDTYRQHLAGFLKEVVPVAEESGIKLSIHPDDPPFLLLGLPRIVSSKEDLEWIVSRYDSISNGITFCTGSLSVRDNDRLVNIIRSVGHRIHFLHLRNNILLPGGSFHEYGHIEGCVDMYSVMKALLEEQRRRTGEGRSDIRMPLRPDHGIKMLDDFNRDTNPGYPLTGRVKGLAELTGLETGIERKMQEEGSLAGYSGH